jgi:hypothetical protein
MLLAIITVIWTRKSNNRSFDRGRYYTIIYYEQIFYARVQIQTD